MVAMPCYKVCSAAQELAPNGTMCPPAGYTWTSLESFSDTGSPAVLKSKETCDGAVALDTKAVEADDVNGLPGQNERIHEADRSNGAEGVATVALLEFPMLHSCYAQTAAQMCCIFAVNHASFVNMSNLLIVHLHS
jgi:hypothetical protein